MDITTLDDVAESIDVEGETDSANDLNEAGELLHTPDFEARLLAPRTTRTRQKTARYFDYVDGP